MSLRSYITGMNWLNWLKREDRKDVQMYRHGDVIIERVDALPEGATRRPSAVLARGEATGHSHRIKDPSGVELFDSQSSSYLAVKAETATLIHDEHRPIELPRGVYRFWQQREYSPKEIRTIVD
jgi:hypothetical protein